MLLKNSDVNVNVFTTLEMLFSTFILQHVYFLQTFGACTELPGNIFTLGCLDVTEKFVKDHAAIIGGAGIGVACLMVTITIKYKPPTLCHDSAPPPSSFLKFLFTDYIQ